MSAYNRMEYRPVIDKRGSIVAKLTDLGWGEEIEREMGSYRRRRTLLIYHPLVRQPKELTERSACVSGIHLISFLHPFGSLEQHQTYPD